MPSVSAATSRIGRKVAAFAISMSDSTVVHPLRPAVHASPARPAWSMASSRAPARGEARSVPVSGAALPVLDAVVVGIEPVSDPPEHRVGPAGDLDLAVEVADVGL